MVDLEAITKAIIAGLKLYVPELYAIILADPPARAPKPQWPYATLKWMLPYIPDGVSPNRLQAAVPSTDPSWEYDVQYTYVRQPTATLSVNVFDEPMGIGIDAIAQKCWEWFSIYELGGAALERQQAVVREVTAIENRDTVLSEDYERRRGFDVRLRLLDTTVIRVPTIETAEVTHEEW